MELAKKALRKARSMNVREVHVEAIVVDQIYDRLLAFLKNNDGILLALVTPREYPIMSQLYNLSMDRIEFASIMKRRYIHLKWLKAHGLSNLAFAIHIHFTTPKNMNLFTYDEQLETIHKATKFFEEIGLPTTDYIPGAWAWNEDTIKACKKLGIKNFHTKPTGPYKHDYEL